MQRKTRLRPALTMVITFALLSHFARAEQAPAPDTTAKAENPAVPAAKVDSDAAAKRDSTAQGAGNPSVSERAANKAPTTDSAHTALVPAPAAVTGAPAMASTAADSAHAAQIPAPAADTAAPAIAPTAVESAGSQIPQATKPFALALIDSVFMLEGQRVVALPIARVLKEIIVYNPQVVSARLEWLSGKHRAWATWGGYGPDLIGGYKRGGFEKITSRFMQETEDYNASVEARTPLGGTVNLGFSLTDVQNSNYLYTQPRAFSGVTVKQPLAKGAWFGAPWADIEIARINEQVVFHSYRTDLMRILYEVESTYWDLSFKENKFKFATESVDIAVKLVRDAEARLMTGKMSSLEVLEARAGLAMRQATQEDAKRDLWEAMNRLKILLSSDSLDEELYISAQEPLFIPREKLDHPFLPDTLDSAFFMIQPDWLIKKNEMIKQDKLFSHEKNNLLPEVNLEGSYGYYGSKNATHSALDELANRGRTSWSAGVNVKVPLTIPVKDWNLLKVAEYNQKLAARKLRTTEYEVRSNLSLIKDRILSLRKRILNSQQEVEYRKKLLAVELEKFAAGKSNYRLIYDIEEDLAKAKELELESHMQYREALMQLSRVSGKMLLERGLEKLEKDKLVLDERISE